MESKINVVFNNQQKHHELVRNYSFTKRIATLRALRSSIQKYEDQIYLALQKDLQKNAFEAAVTELFFVYSEIDFAIKNLRKWMRPVKIGKTLTNPFAKNRLRYEPKGVCLIIAPWNYPFQLTIGPLISAIAAGNCVIVKPSELSVETSKVVLEVIETTFEAAEIACFEGGVDVSSQLLALPFDHIFFTGSTAVGKLVMEAAAKNLSGITLELGGKSPTIIDSSANLRNAAEKIAWGKLTNCGQTCIAPDHIFVPEHLIDQFIGYYKAAAIKMYFKSNTKIDHSSYGKIISEKHFARLKYLIEDAVKCGARINWGGYFEDQNLIIAPVILTKLHPQAKIMQEEIFGPILPVLAYRSLDEVMDQVNQRGKALALYIFSEDKRNIDYMIQNTSAGGTCVNDVLVHIANPKLPFGGINGSGIGSSHGQFGFKNFSHERAIVYQRKFNFNRLVYPPYQGKEWVLKLLQKIS